MVHFAVRGDRRVNLGVGHLSICALGVKLRVFFSVPENPSAVQAFHAGLGLACWVDDEDAVILLDGECPEGLMLSATLRAMGMQVFLGPHIDEAIKSPLILMRACNRNKDEIVRRLQLARQIFPEAPVCFVTDHNGPITALPLYEDSRDVLRAAGIGFVCG
jgi:hypothetical protein